MANPVTPTPPAPAHAAPVRLRKCPKWCTSAHKYDSAWCVLHSHAVGIHRPDPGGYSFVSVRVQQRDDDPAAPVVQVITDTHAGLDASAVGHLAADDAVAVAFAFEACGTAEVAELLRAAAAIAHDAKAEAGR